MKPEVLPLSGREQSDDALTRAAAVLNDGGLVAFPTDTVYGLGARVDRPDAVERIYRVKDRDRSKPLARLVPDASSAAAAAGVWPRIAAKFARMYWPGALTIVVGGIGVRVPAHQEARSLAARVAGGLAATSANKSGDADACTAEEVVAMLGDSVDLVLDGGRSGGTPSTVALVEAGGVEGVTVVREGSVSADELQAAARAVVLIVCRGNTCRSPMAAALMRNELAAVGRADIDVLSAGTDVGGDAHGGACALAREATAELGLGLADHAVTGLAPAMLGKADWVYAMDRSQIERIIDLLPEEQDHLELIDPHGEGVPDPYGGQIETYRQARDRIAEAVRARAAQIHQALESEGEEAAA